MAERSAPGLSRVHKVSFWEGAAELPARPTTLPHRLSDSLWRPGRLFCWICSFQFFPPASCVTQMD